MSFARVCIYVCYVSYGKIPLPNQSWFGTQVHDTSSEDEGEISEGEESGEESELDIYSSLSQEMLTKLSGSPGTSNTERHCAWKFRYFTQYTCFHMIY